MNGKESNNIRKTIPCGKLRQMYVNEAKSDAIIASMFKVSKNSVQRRRQDCDIPTRMGPSYRQSKTRIRLDRERLLHLYVDQQKNEKEIAAIMGCDFRIVKRNLSDYGIKVRKVQRLYDVIGKDSLRRMYETDLRTDASIAEEFGVSLGAIYQLRKRYGIKSRLTLMRARIESADLKGMYRNKHMSASDIANKLGCSESVIYNRLEALGIPLHEDHSRGQSEYLRWCKVEGRKSRQRMISFLGGRCQICSRAHLRQYHIHHMCYMASGDIVRGDYVNRHEYYVMLHQAVMREKWRFRLLCGTCHSLIGPLSTWLPGQVNALTDILRVMDEKKHEHPTRYDDA